MQVLKIIEGLRSELTKNGVVICTFIKDGIEFDGISIEHLKDYSQLEIIIIAEQKMV